jgi:hypothetical protein
MRSTDDPASLSPDEGPLELAGIFAAGVLRLRLQSAQTVRPLVNNRGLGSTDIHLVDFCGFGGR